jgi:hypothetical protein
MKVRRATARGWVAGLIALASACDRSGAGTSAARSGEPPRTLGAANPAEASSSVGAASASASASAAMAEPPAPIALPPELSISVDDLAAKLKKDVAALPAARSPGSPGWAAARKTCADRFTAAGLSLAEARFHGAVDGVDQLGRSAGLSRPGELVVLSAHYDHFATCPGADDDGSGLAAIFEVAELIGRDRRGRSLELACFDQEGDGLVGSRAYAGWLRKQKRDVVLAISLDAVGFASSAPGSQRIPDGIGAIAPDVVSKVEARGRRADFIAAIGDDRAAPYVELFDRAAARAGVPSVTLSLGGLSRVLAGDVNRSDHAAFWLAGFPAMLVTDTANFRNPRYHCERGVDAPASLDYRFLARVTLGVADLVRAASLTEP